MATRKYRKFSEGGVTSDDLEVANNSEDPIQTLNKRKGWTDTGEESETATPKKQSFKEAFAAARKGGGKTFEWEGKKYTTEMAGEKKAAPKPADKPAAKPAAKYEAPYDRMNRENREAGRDIGSVFGRLKERVMGAGDRGQDRILRNTKSGEVDSKTLLPTGMKKGGSVKGWGMARGARKAKIV